MGHQKLEIKKRYQKSEAVKHLEDLMYKDKLARFPNFPYPVKCKYRDDTANSLTRCIVDFICLMGGFAERINSMGQQITENGKTRWIKGSSTKGTADIHAVVKGRTVMIEVKIGNDRQSEHQKKYQQSIEQAGGFYFIAKEFAGFLEWYLNNFKNYGK